MEAFPTKAMILAAGLGERLRPLTLTTPKPLIPVGKRLLIEYNIYLLKKYGVKEITINLHHLSDKIQGALGDGKAYGVKLFYNYEPTLLGTGGGIKDVENFFAKNPFVVMNGDILLDIDLGAVWKQHQQSKALATLVVSPTERKDVKRLVYLDEKNEVLDIAEKSSVEGSRGYVFTGVQIAEARILDELPADAQSCVVQNAYLPLLEKNEKLGGFICFDYFRDLGTPERYEEVKKEFAQNWPYTTLKPEDMAS